MKRGDVYWATLTPRSGSEQAGRRSVIVVPVSTSASQARRGPTAVALPAGAGGLAHESVALCHQVTTLDRPKLAALLGSLTAAHLREVEDGLRIALGMV